MHNPSISMLGPGPDVMLIEGFDCSAMLLTMANVVVDVVLVMCLYIRIGKV